MLLASSSDDKTVIVRDGATYDVVRTLTNHTAPVHALVFSSSGDFLASGSADNTAVITRVSGGVDHIIRTFRGHIAPVVSLCFSFDGHVLYTASADTTIRLWDIATQAPLVIHRFPEGFATTVPKAVKDGRLLFAGSSSGFINFWKSNQEKPLRSLKLSPLAVNSIEIIPETSEIFVGCADGKAFFLDINTGGVVFNFPDSSSAIYSIAVHYPRKAALLASSAEASKSALVEELKLQAASVPTLKKYTVAPSTDYVPTTVIKLNAPVSVSQVSSKAMAVDKNDSSSMVASLKALYSDITSTSVKLQSRSSSVPAVTKEATTLTQQSHSTASSSAKTFLASSSEDGVIRLYNDETSAKIAEMKVGFSINRIR